MKLRALRLLTACKPLLSRYFGTSPASLSKCSKTKRLSPPWKILFFGTDTFSMQSLQPLCAKLRTGTLMESLGVVSKVGTVVNKFATEEGLPFYPWPLSAGDIKEEYHIGMVVSFGALIPKDIIEAFPLGCINVHASLLPRWRGASPINHALIHGDSETGVTIMKIHPFKFDVGEIVRQYRIPIMEGDCAQDVEKKLSLLGSQLLMECLRDLPRCLDMATPQPREGITYAPKLTSKLSLVQWDTLTAKDVDNLHRGIGHLHHLTTFWNGHKVKLLDISLSKDLKDNLPTNEPSGQTEEAAKISALDFLNVKSKKSSNQPKSEPTRVGDKCGVCVFDKKKKELRVFCSDNKCIVVHRLSISKKQITGLDFYNGYLSKPGVEQKFVS